MTYALSAALQAAVFRRLSNDAVLNGLIGGAIHDAPLEAAPRDVPVDHVTLGEEFVRANGTKTSEGAIHDFTVTVHSGRDGFDRVKRIAAAVCDALLDVPLTLAGGRVVATRFLRAKAERGRAPEKRKVSLLFRAVLEQDG